MIVNENNATFLNCKCEGNHAKVGSAIYGDLWSNISVVNSIMNHNSAAESGGAIFIGSVDIENCCNDDRQFHFWPICIVCVNDTCKSERITIYMYVHYVLKPYYNKTL